MYRLHGGPSTSAGDRACLRISAIASSASMSTLHRIRMLESGLVPSSSPSSKTWARNCESGRLTFGTDAERRARLPGHLRRGRHPVTAATASRPHLSLKVVEDVAPPVRDYKSGDDGTVPLGSGRRVQPMLPDIAARSASRWTSPRTPSSCARLGDRDFMRPNRVVIGAETDARANDARDLPAALLARDP